MSGVVGAFSKQSNLVVSIGDDVVDSNQLLLAMRSIKREGVAYW
jgi:hypothetical protein